MSIVINLNKNIEKLAEKQANISNVSITQYFSNLVITDGKKNEIKKDIIQSLQELNLMKEGKIKTNSINNLFNA
ncbi:MAG: hypothetical protein Q9M94_03550 [Candidatus Gracilibacteria bacterium]|nr:hypothetical protein [Candidatus Gracilibacteria bacterium]MDQ7023389.1 hypothetical protein [Candidatus Gracilibacteria bacterium]